jgi:Xaa-Pro aminopeptidase
MIDVLYPHNIGHPLGQDIHEEEPNFDVKFKPGMVITVEPGIYIPSGLKNIPENFLGMGIRIEDNILITEDGNENITQNTPKEIDVIEKIMSKKNEYHSYIQNNFKF